MIAEAAEMQLRSTLREILIVEAEMEKLQRGAEILQGRCASISVENTRLGVNIREQEADAVAVLEKFTAYRNKMQAHRAAVELAFSQTQEHKALEESRALVRRLTQQRDELREDLDNPKGNTAQREKVEKGEQNSACQGVFVLFDAFVLFSFTAQGEAEALEEEVSRRRRTIGEKRNRLEEEMQIQAHIREDIEVKI